MTVSLRSIVSEFSGENFWIKMDIEGREELVFALDQNLNFLDKMKGILYEIHSRKGLGLLNKQFVRIGLRPSRIFYESDFANNTFRGFLRHPVLLHSFTKTTY